jgi:hypothetical protein
MCLWCLAVAWFFGVELAAVVPSGFAVLLQLEMHVWGCAKGRLHTT